MANAIVNASLLVNGSNPDIVPNSFTIVRGTGERQVRNQTAGAGQSEPVYFEDVASQIGTVEFEMFPTKENLDFIDDITSNGPTNVVQFISNEGYTGTMTSALVTNDPEINLGVDGKIKIVIKGSQITT